MKVCFEGGHVTMISFVIILCRRRMIMFGLKTRPAIREWKLLQWIMKPEATPIPLEM